MEKVTIDKKDLASRDRKIDEQKARIAELEAMTSTNNNSVSVGTEDRELLGDLYEPVKKIVASAMGSVTSEINGNFKKLTTSIETLQENINTQNQSLFSGVASTALKNYQEIKNSQEFADFLEGRVAGVGVTWGDSWESSKKKNDIQTMQEIVDKFLASEKGQEVFGEKAEVKVTEEGEDESEGGQPNVEPNGSASNSGLDSNSKYLFKASDYSAMMTEFKERRISDEEMTEFEAKFNEAVDKGQVLDDREQTHQ